MLLCYYVIIVFMCVFSFFDSYWVMSVLSRSFFVMGKMNKNIYKKKMGEIGETSLCEQPENRKVWISHLELCFFTTLDGFGDVTGWSSAASGVVSVYKYQTVSSSSLFPPQNNLFTSDVYSLLISVSISHPPKVSALLYLSTFLPESFFLSFCLSDMSLFAWTSHFLFGVCVDDPFFLCPTHIKHLLLKMRGKDWEEGIKKEYYDRMMVKVDVSERRCVWVESQDERGNPGQWHRHRKKKEKGKNNRNHKAADYITSLGNGQIRPETCQTLRSYCKNRSST